MKVNIINRPAYCTGCCVTFEKMHLMINHRRLERCGGRFLSKEKRTQLNARKIIAQFSTLDIRQREEKAQAEKARSDKVISLARRERAQRELARRILRSRGSDSR